MLRTLEERRRNLDQSLQALLADPSIVNDYLRYYQTDAVKGIHSTVQRSRTRSYVQMPTSSGKTEVMLAMVQALCRNADISDLPRMFMVEPTQKLVRDTRARFHKYFPQIPVGVYYADEQDLKNPLTIITGDSFNDLLESGELKPEQIDYLFLDEAHRWLTKLRRHALKPFYETSVITGFTATSSFNELKALYRTLGTEAYRIDYATLIAENYISERANVIVGMKLPDEVGLREQRRAYSHAVKDIILQYRDVYRDGEDITSDRIMIFEWEVNDAKYTADLLNNDPDIRNKLIVVTGNPDIIPAAAIHGGLSRTKLDAIIKSFDDGDIRYLVGSRIHIEGLDTKARHVITPERWSELEMEQVGGRVRDRSGLCRIFTICPENSGKRKPAFYSDSIGAVRITRQGQEHGYARSLEHLVLEHPPVNNLNIYNSPAEIASYVKSREQKKPNNKATSYYGPSRMAEAIIAWPLEIDYIYNLLNAQHKILPSTEAYCHVGGINIPRRFLRSHENEIFVREDAAEIILDIVGHYKEKPSRSIVYSDIEASLAPHQAASETAQILLDADQLFDSAGRAFASVYLPWKYGTETQNSHSIPLPASISVNGIRIPLSHIETHLDGNGVSVGIRENVLARFWTRHIADVGVDLGNFKTSLAEISGENNYFGEIIERYEVRRQAAIRAEWIDLTETENWQKLTQLLTKKGNPGGKRIFQSLPPESKQSDKETIESFRGEYALNNIIYRNQDTLHPSQWDLLISTLEGMPDRPPKGPFIDLTNPEIRKRLSELHAQKGNAIPARIYDALPTNSKISDEHGQTLFNGLGIICNVLSGRQKRISLSRWDLLINALISLPDRTPPPVEALVDLTKPENKQRLDQLWEQKGRIGTSRIFNCLPLSARTPDLHGNVLWRKVTSLDRVLVKRGRNQKTLRQSQWDVLLSTLEGIPDRPSPGPYVDLTDPVNRQKLDDLLDQKGNPSAHHIFLALPSEVKTPDGNGDVLIRGSNNIHHWLSGAQRNVRQTQWDILLQTLEGMSEDSVSQRVPSKAAVDVTEPETRRKLDELLERKGNPGARRILSVMPEEIRLPNEYDSQLFGTNPQTQIYKIISGGKQGLRQAQWECLVEALEKLPDEAIIDLTESANEQTLNELLQRKGRPGAVSIFSAMPDSAKRPNEYGETLFPNLSALISIIYRNRKKLYRSQWEILKIALRNMPDKRQEKLIDLTSEKNHQTLEELLARKGNPTPTQIFDLLQVEAKIPDSDGEILFKSSAIVQNIAYERQKTARQSQWDTLLITLEQMPDRTPQKGLEKIRISDDDWGAIDDLLEQKGNPGAKEIWDVMPSAAKSPNEDGDTLFPSIEVLYRVLQHKRQVIWKLQWDAITAALEGMPDRPAAVPPVNLADPSTHQCLLEIWNKKGRPGSKRIFAALPDAAKCADEYGNVLFRTEAIIAGSLSGYQKTISQERYDVMIATLDSMPELSPFVDLSDESPQWQSLAELWERKGYPGSKTIFLALPAVHTQPDSDGVALFGSYGTIESVLKHKQLSIRKAQLEALVECIETMPDMGVATIDMREGSPNRLYLDDLLKRKGNPGFNRIYGLLPAEAKTEDVGGWIIFLNAYAVQSVLTGIKKFIYQQQFDALVQALEKIPDIAPGDHQIDISEKSLNRKAFDEVWEEKNQPGLSRIFKALPISAKQPDGSGRVLFTNMHVIGDILNGKKRLIFQFQFDVLMATLRSMPSEPKKMARVSSVDVSKGSANRKLLDDLMTQKGNPGPAKVFKALPAELNQLDVNGAVAFQSVDSLRVLLYGEWLSAREEQFDVLVATLRTMPDTGAKIDLSEGTSERMQLHQLWAQKGHPTGGYIFSRLSHAQEASEDDMIFGVAATIDGVLKGKQRSLRRNQFDLLVATLQGMPNSDSKVVREKKRRAAKETLERSTEVEKIPHEPSTRKSGAQLEDKKPG